jgi:hypothetical protein
VIHSGTPGAAESLEASEHTFAGTDTLTEGWVLPYPVSPKDWGPADQLCESPSCCEQTTAESLALVNEQVLVDWGMPVDLHVLRDGRLDSGRPCRPWSDPGSTS